jgi:DNA-binding NarL/FixJ family response regulator
MDLVSVAVIDDNALLRNSLIERLEHTGKIKVLLSAISGADILSKVAHLPVSSRPLLYLMDIEMDDLDGIEATTRLKKIQPDALVIMLTVFEDEDKILRAIQSGASGYLLKDEPTDTLLRAIDDVLAGGSYMTPIIARKALNLLRSNTTEAEAQDADERPLTTREREILELIVSGVSYPDIAEALFISHETVRKHVRNIYEKLHVHNKVDAMRIAIKRKWFQV